MSKNGAPVAINFMSDNAVSVHPKVWETLIAHDSGYATPYGNDDITKKLQQKLVDVFETDCVAFPITNGTACNSLILSALVRSDEAILCHDFAHISNEECNAPELFTGGARLLGLGGNNERLTPGAVDDFIRRGWQNRDHSPHPACVSITQLNELGLRYTRSEIKALADYCHDHGMTLHMDGARFANAVAGGAETVAELSHLSGVDALSFGFTKNGALAAEVAVFFNPSHASRFARLRKRGGQLWSKMRYISGQMLGLLEDDLWLKMATDANLAAQRLAKILQSKGIEVLYPVDGNHVFTSMSQSQARRMREHGALFYQWQKIDNAYRFVTAWNTSQESLDLMEQCDV